MRIYGLKTCDTCRKVRKALPNADFVDVREDALSQALLAEFHAVFGDALVNRRSTTWKGLSEAERQRDPLELLAAHPTLMKRPVIVDGAQHFLGWTPEVKAKLLGKGANGS